MFITPKRSRKAAEMELPMIPPTLLKDPNFEDTADAVAATTMEVATTILEERALVYGGLGVEGEGAEEGKGGKSTCT